MKHQIVSAAYGYQPVQLRSFLRSAREHAPDAEITLFCHQADAAFAEQIAALNPAARVRLPPDFRWRRLLWRSRKSVQRLGSVVRFFPRHRGAQPPTSFLSALMHVSLARVLWIEALLRAEMPSGAVLLSDSRDVVFQGNPFAAAGERLICGEEPMQIGRCRYNRAWIEQAYGEPWAKRLADNPVLCSGVVLGSAPTISSYLASMVSEIAAQRARLLASIGLDQGLHNKLLQGDRVLPWVGVRNGEALLATLNYSDLSEFRFHRERGLETLQGEPVRIVHQYDRAESLRDWVARRYG